MPGERTATSTGWCAPSPAPPSGWASLRPRPRGCRPCRRWWRWRHCHRWMPRRRGPVACQPRRTDCRTCQRSSDDGPWPTTSQPPVICWSRVRLAAAAPPCCARWLDRWLPPPNPPTCTSTPSMPAAAAWRRWPSCHTAGRSCPATSQSDWTDCLTLNVLLAEVRRRQRVLATDGHLDVAEQRAAVAAVADRLPYLLVFAHQWDALLAAYQDLDGGRVIDAVLRLLADGSAVGLRAVVTGDRATLLGRLAAVMSDRLLLQLADPADYGVVGLRPAAVPRRLPHGRGWTLDGLVSTQVAVLGPDPAGATTR